MTRNIILLSHNITGGESLIIKTASFISRLRNIYQLNSFKSLLIRVIFIYVVGDFLKRTSAPEEQESDEGSSEKRRKEENAQSGTRVEIYR